MRDMKAAVVVSAQDVSTRDPNEMKLSHSFITSVDNTVVHQGSCLENSNLPQISCENDLHYNPLATDIPRVVSRESMLGYHYLCGERRESQDVQEGHQGLTLLRLQLEEGCFAEKELIQSEDIQEILERNGIEIAMWNHIVATTDDELLGFAVAKARALALGFDQDTPHSVVDAEAAIVKDRFAEREFERILEALERLAQNPDLHDGRIDEQGVIELHEIILKSNRDIPPEGFGSFHLTFQDILDFPSNILKKLQVWTAAFFRSGEEHEVKTGEMEAISWLSPVPESILSPSIQGLFKKLEEKNISYECTSKRDNRGFLLKFRFFIEPEKLTDISGGHRL